MLYACSGIDTETLHLVNNGRELYTTHCSNCHQLNGEGLKGIIPPLKNADYLKANMKDLPCMIRNGMKGKIVVNGKEFNMEMPANKKLSDKDVLYICNYVAFVFADSSQLMSRDLEAFKNRFAGCTD